MNTNSYTFSIQAELQKAFTIWIVFLVFIIVYLNYLFQEKTPNTKTGLAKWYGVDKKTFNKWIRYFCQSIYPDIKIYQRKRKLPKVEVNAIINTLGSPKYYPILSKNKIIDISESNYRVLRASVNAYPEKFGLSKEAFKAIQKFPPKISKNIMLQFDPDRVNWVLDKPS